MKLFKRIIAIAVVLAVALCAVACTKKKEESDVMTYAEYKAAATDDAVIIRGYVQAKQSWWDNKATVYLQDKDGAYFCYNLDCTEEDYAKLTEGTLIEVRGYKGEFAGEEEVAEGASWAVVEGAEKWIATATDVTAKLGTDDMVNYQNQKVSFKDLIVVPSKDSNNNDVAWLYKWNGTGSEGDDLYFNVTDGKAVYTFTVESYLCGKDTDVYKAVKALTLGDKIDLEGFAYWYNGLNPHITSCTVTEKASTITEFNAAETDTHHIVCAYVQAKQSWWDNKATLYLENDEGATLAYNATCSEELYAKLTTGVLVRLDGYRAEFAGEKEFGEGTTVTILPSNEDTYTPIDVTAKLGTEEMINYQNYFVAFSGLTVVASKDANDQEVAWLYKWNGTGAEGDDLYFNVSDGTNTYTFTVESYLCGSDTEVYKAVKALTIGQKVNMEGFAYWYNGLNPHITKVEVVTE